MRGVVPCPIVDLKTELPGRRGRGKALQSARGMVCTAVVWPPPERQQAGSPRKRAIAVTGSTAAGARRLAVAVLYAPAVGQSVSARERIGQPGCVWRRPKRDKRRG
jgi:hypothetical protein